MSNKAEEQHKFINYQEEDAAYLELEREFGDEDQDCISISKQLLCLALEEKFQGAEPNHVLFSEQVKEACLELEGKITDCIDKFKTMQCNFLQRLEECIKEMRIIADDVDKFHKRTIIANITGSSFGIAGGITTIVGLCLAPVTFGASLIVAGVGIGVATAGGVTGAAASIADRVNIKLKCNKVEEIIKEINNEREKMQAMLANIDSLIRKMTDLIGLNTDIIRAGVRGAYTAAEIARLFQLVRLSATAARGAQIAARGAQAAAAVSGVFAALFILVDIGFVVKGALDLKKGAKSEEAAKIRSIADELEIDCKQIQLVEKDFVLQNCKALMQS